MQWEKPSQELIELLVTRMEPFGAQKKKMFGSTCYFANDKMFTGVHESHIFLKLSEKDRDEIKALYKDTTQFEPMKGRPMREYVNLSPLLYRDQKIHEQWIERSMKYVMSMPAKAAKTKKK